MKTNLLSRLLSPKSKTCRPHQQRPMQVETLESRKMMAILSPFAPTAADDYAETSENAAFTVDMIDNSSDAGFAAQTNSRVLVFVDSAVDGYQDLIQDLLGPTDSRANVEVVILDADRDGIAQMSETLSQYTDVAAIHVLSHGSSGSLRLGSTRLDGDNLDDYAAQLGAWGESLVAGADILLYGCNVAEGEWGIEFVEDLAAATGADVAASDDLTGAAVLGGDWVLETSTGPIESPAFSAAGDYADVLYDVCSDFDDDEEPRCTHEEMAGYAGEVYAANGASPQFDIEAVMDGAGHEDEVDHIYGWHTSPIPGAVTLTHFWDADNGPAAGSYLDFTGAYAIPEWPFHNSWDKAGQYWSMALGEIAIGNTANAYHFLGHIAHQIGDNTIPTHVHVSAHDPESGDDSFEDWMSQGATNEYRPSEAPGSDLSDEELAELSQPTYVPAAGGHDPLEMVDLNVDIPEFLGEETPLDKLYWLLYTTNQIAGFFPSDRVDGEVDDPLGWVKTELTNMSAANLMPREAIDLKDNDKILAADFGSSDYDNNVDGDLGVIREYSYLRGIRAIAGLYKLFDQTVATQTIVAVKIETVKELDDHDYFLGAETSNADFYSRVSINGFEVRNEGDRITANNDAEEIHPDWVYGRVVDMEGSLLIPIWIEIWDADSIEDDAYLGGDDDQSNITNARNRRLEIDLNRNACLNGDDFVSAAFTTNEGTFHDCDQSVTTHVSADDSDDTDGVSRVTYSISMFQNSPPTADVGGPYTIHEGGYRLISGLGSSDPNQSVRSLTYEWDLDNDGSYDDSTAITPYFAATSLDGPTTQTIGLRVTDDAGLTDTDTTTVTILNVAPTLTLNPDELDDDGVALLRGTISDPGTQDTFTMIVNWADGSTFDNDNDASTPAEHWETFTFGPAASGSQEFVVPHVYPQGHDVFVYEVQVYVWDDDLDGNSGKTSFGGFPPTISADVTEIIVDEREVASVGGSFADDGADDVTITASVGTITQDAGNSGTWTWSFDTSDGPDDSQPVTITATDSTGAISTTAFDLVVNNLPPTVFITEVISVDEGDTAVGGVYVDDRGNDSVTVSASIGTLEVQGDHWRWSLDTSVGSVESQTVTITAIDSDGAVSTSTFDLVVNNLPPKIRIQDFIVVVDEGDTATATISADDPGNDSVTVTASIGALDFDGGSNWIWSLDTSVEPVESQTVTITATDSDGASSTTQFDLVVNNLPPTIRVDVAEVIVNEREIATNLGSFDDAGGAENVRMTASLGTVIWDSRSGIWSWYFDTSDGPDESQTVTITAIDRDGASSTTTFDLIVNNLPPWTPQIREINVVIDQGDTALAEISAGDPGNDDVTVTASIGTLDFDGSKWNWSLDTSVEPAESQTVTITVTDSDGAQTTAEFPLWVNSTQDVPADLTGNGFVDFEDLTVLLANWNQDVSAAEGNLVDAVTTPVNFEDLTVLLAGWTGPGPAGAPGPQAVAAAVSESAGASTPQTSNAEGRLAISDHFDRLGRRDDLRSRSAGRRTERSISPDDSLRRLQAAAIDRAMSGLAGDGRIGRRSRR